MKSEFNYRRWLRKHRDRINALLIPRIRKAFPHPYLALAVKRCLLPGRKVRSSLFHDTLRILNPATLDQTSGDIVLSIELLHSASVLVDDILDSDQFRHGLLAAESEWGVPKALLFAHLMSNAAIKNLTSLPEMQSNLLEAYRGMCVGEMYDIFLPQGGWILKGYGRQVSQKTSSLFRFALSSAQTLAGPKFASLDLGEVGEELGVLYQLSNDYFDWQSENLEKRHLKTSSWRITFSLPLATYLERFGRHDVVPFLSKKVLNYDEWVQFLSIIWSPPVSKQCRSIISRVQNGLLRRVSRGRYPKRLKALYVDFSRQIIKREFWYHPYDIPKK